MDVFTSYPPVYSCSTMPYYHHDIEYLLKNTMSTHTKAVYTKAVRRKKREVRGQEGRRRRLRVENPEL